ncbi:MAG: DUF1266 domain-containing protein [Pseudomonadota bacterium]|nr:DUF1266 domain-containing protein [Pseudomonadota bacterium]
MATPPQRWALALGAVLTELNQGFHHELGGWGSGEHTAGWCRSALANSWGVTDEASFRATSGWLWAEGHGVEIMNLLANLGPDPRKDDEKAALVRANRALLEGKGLLAWDLGRYVAVVGWGRWAGFVSEPEAWQMIHGAAVRVQRAFKSWREFGRHYEFGRYYWSGQDDARCEAVIAKLTKDPASPWMQLDWKLPLGPTPAFEEPGGEPTFVGAAAVGAVVKPAVAPGVAVAAEPSQPVRIKRTSCHACGAPKQLPPTTGWVYCDRCGTLADWDFRKACEGGSALPGPAYEQILSKLAPALDAARNARDGTKCVKLQRQLFTAWVEACPKSVPPRAAEATYRAAYVEYLASAAVATDLDSEWQVLAMAVKGATQGIQFEGDPRKPRVRSAAFWTLYGAVKRQVERGMRVYAESGVLELHPDEASAELQSRLTWSVFAQGWLPFLAEADGERLLAETGLAGDYDILPSVAHGIRHCGGCGNQIAVVAGATRVVCEACGHRVEVGVAEIPCTQCAGMISLPVGKERVACPFCEAMVVRV